MQLWIKLDTLRGILFIISSDDDDDGDDDNDINKYEDDDDGDDDKWSERKTKQQGKQEEGSIYLHVFAKKK